MFHCNCCGECCKNITLSPIYIILNRGDGICKYLNEKNNLCSIYENRPIECNIDKMYDVYFSKKISKEKYYQLNYYSCKKLKNL